MGRKILTIGITINLENYENLRLEVQGEIGPEGTTEELISFLDGMLARLGHGDEATAELVDAYRRRVLAMPGTGGGQPRAPRPAPAKKAGEGPAPRPAEPAQPASPPPPRAARGQPDEAARTPRETRGQAEAPHDDKPPREEMPPTVRVSPEAKSVKQAARPAARPEAAAPPVQVPEPRKGPVPAPAGEPVKEQPPAAGKAKVAEGEVACEGCGASITKNQEKLSRLLTGKSLCKRCMNP